MPGCRRSRARPLRPADPCSGRCVLPDHAGHPVAAVLAGRPGGLRPGLGRGGGSGSRGRRLHRRAGPGGPLPGRQRPADCPPAALHQRVHRHGELAAPAAAAGSRDRGGRGRAGRLADLAAHRRAGSAPGPPGPAGGGPAGRDGALYPGRWRGHPRRGLPGRDGRHRDPGHAVLGRSGWRRGCLRLGRAGRADHQLPAGARGGATAQTRAGGGLQRRSRPAGPGWPPSAPRPARRCRCSARAGTP